MLEWVFGLGLILGGNEWMMVEEQQEEQLYLLYSMGDEMSLVQQLYWKRTIVVVVSVGDAVELFVVVAVAVVVDNEKNLWEYSPG